MTPERFSSFEAVILSVSVLPMGLKIGADLGRERCEPHQVTGALPLRAFDHLAVEVL